MPALDWTDRQLQPPTLRPTTPVSPPPAQDWADRMVALLSDPAPPWRVPMGPTVRARRLLRTVLPDWGWEFLLQRLTR